MVLEKHFEVCFLVKKFDFEANSKHSKLATKPQETDFKIINSRASCLSPPRNIDQNREETSSKPEELASCQVYKLPSLLRNYTPKEKKKHQNVIPQVSVQGQKCLENEHNFAMDNKKRISPSKSSTSTSTCKPCLIVSSDEIVAENRTDNGEEANKFVDESVLTNENTCIDAYNYTSTEKNLSGLEGRKVNLETKLNEQRTLRRIERLKAVRFENKKEMKEFYFPHAQDVNYKNLVFKEEKASKDNFERVNRRKHGSESKCEVAAEYENYFRLCKNSSPQECHKSQMKNPERKVIELPKVESYDILTPHKIITSDVCYVFKEKAVAKVTVSHPSRDSILQNQKNKLCNGKKLAFNKMFEQKNIVEMRDPSPVHGLKLNPKKEIESIDEALKLVEESNLADNNKVEIAEKKLEACIPVKTFVVHLPPIF